MLGALLLFMDTTMSNEEIFATILGNALAKVRNNLADTQPSSENNVEVTNQKEEGINPMNIESNWPPQYPCVTPATYGVKVRGSMANAQIINAAPVEATQRDYAIELIKSIGEKHNQTLRAQFNMNPTHPQTWTELKALIDVGDFTVDKDVLDSEYATYAGPLYGVTFGKPADKDGYKIAQETLKAAAQKALTAVTLKPIDQLETAIDDFEAWVYTPAN